jgi:hypothetical protein
MVSWKKNFSQAALMFAFTVWSSALAQEVSEAWDENIVERVRSSPFSVEASAGVEYDSNVSVIEIDTATAEGDFAAVLDFAVEYETDLGDKTTLEVGYDFGQDIQFDFTNFNTQTHRGYAEISHDFGDAEVGASYQLIYSRLGGSGFLRLHRLSPYVASYVGGKRAYVRAAYIYTDKEFIGRADRDGDAHAGSIDVYYFINGLTTYVIGGYRYESENVVSPEFDFNAHNLKARLVQRIPFRGENAKLRAGWRYENRDYNAITPSIGVIRGDSRHRFEVSFEAPLTDVVYAEAEYRFDSFDSNLPSADFNQSVATIRVGGRL